MLIESFLHSQCRVYGSLGCSDWGSMTRISLKEYVAASMYGIESEGRHDTVLVLGEYLSGRNIRGLSGGWC